MRPASSILDMLNSSGGNAELFAYGAARQTLRNHQSNARNVGLNQLLPANALAGHIRSGDMLPIVSADDLVNGFQPNAVTLGNIFSVFSASNALKNVFDLFLRKFRRAGCTSYRSLAKPRVVCVLDVFRVRNPLKVAKSVVRFVAVDMVGVVSFWGWASKRGENKAMNNQRGLLFAGRNQADSGVTSRVKHWFQYSINAATFTARKAFDATKVAYRINAFPFGNVFPVFHHGKTMPHHGTNCQ